MSEPWKVGDIALCTHSGGWLNARKLTFGIGPDSGFIGTVNSISSKEVAGFAYLGLGFAEFTGHFAASCFVKITPGPEPKGSEIERERFKQGNPWKVPA